MGNDSAEPISNLSPDPISRSSVSDRLTEQILELIRRENLKPGDRLPSIRSLAENFAVAAPTLREAMRRLQASGVVQIRHGSGIYVSNQHERIVLANPNHRKIEPDVVLHLLDARLLIEPRLAELTAQNASDDEVKELGRLLGEAEQYLRGNDEILHSKNMRFHSAIANFSGNFVLAQIIDSLIELYSFEQLAIISFYNNRPGDHEEHLGIYAAIRDRNPVLARELMYRHIEGVRVVIEERMGGNVT